MGVALLLAGIVVLLVIVAIAGFPKDGSF